MITIKNLKDMLDRFSDNDVVEAYEFEDEDTSLWNILGVFKGGLSWVQGKLPDYSSEPIGLISTILSEVVVFTGEEDGKVEEEKENDE